MQLNLYGSIMNEKDKISYISKIKDKSLKSINIENDTLFYLSANKKYLTLVKKYYDYKILNHKAFLRWMEVIFSTL